MEVVLTSNLVSLETKTKPACNFQAMATNAFVMNMIWWEVKQEPMQTRDYLLVNSRWQDCGNEPYETHIHKTAKSKPTSNKLKEKVCFTLKMHYFSHYLIRAKVGW